MRFHDPGRQLCLVLPIASLLIRGSSCRYIFCHDPCPTNMVRDDFCACYDPHQTSSNPATEPSALYSDCICTEEDRSHTHAFFRWRPSIYATKFGDVIQLASSKCIDGTVCPMWGPNDSQAFLTGRVGLKVDNWSTHTSLLNGHETYEVYGTLAPLQASARAGYIMNPRTGLLASIQLPIVSSPALAALPPGSKVDCEAACADPAQASLCLKSAADKEEEPGLRKLALHVMANGTTTIAKPELMKLFHVDNDPCDRGDTTISDGHIRNHGDDCTINASVSKTSLVLKLPADLDGTIALRSNSTARIEFGNPESAPTLAISEEDLQHDFGGVISALVVGNGQAIVQTANGCISLGFGAPTRQ